MVEGEVSWPRPASASGSRRFTRSRALHPSHLPTDVESQPARAHFSHHGSVGPPGHRAPARDPLEAQVLIQCAELAAGRVRIYDSQVVSLRVHFTRDSILFPVHRWSIISLTSHSCSSSMPMS